MPNVFTYKQSFNGGEVAPDFYGQITDGKYQTGVATMRNFIALPHGPAQNRPGTKFIRAAKNADSPIRLIPFVYSLEQTYVIEVGPNYMRFHTNGATVLCPTTGVLPWTSVITYAQGALVTYGGSTWYSMVGANLNHTPGPLSAWWYEQPATGEYEIPSLFFTEDIDNLHYAQSNDVLTFVAEESAPYELRRYGATDWRLVGISFGPTISAPATVTAVATVGTGTTTYNYKVSAVTSAGVESRASTSVGTCTNNLLGTGHYNTISWTSVSGALRYNVYKESNGVYAYIGQAEGVNFIDDNIAGDLSKTAAISFSVFTEYGYPAAVTYYEQRRAFGGFDSSFTDPFPQTILMTKPGTEANMDYSLPSIDTDSLRFNIASREVNSIRHLVPLQDLIVLTNAAEWRVSSVDGGALTPSTIQVKAQSYVGSNNVQPVVINNNILFAANRGGHVRELAYSFAAGGYLTGDLSLRAPHLFDGNAITDMSLQKAPQQVAWFCSTTGQLLGLTYVPEQQLAAWHRHDTVKGFFRSVCAVPEGNEDAVYVAVIREINGVTQTYIERFSSRQFVNLEDAWFVDCGLSTNTATATYPSMQISGGVTWGPSDSFTLTAGSALFSYPGTSDIGDEIRFTDDAGTDYVMTIETVSSTTVATGTVDKAIDLAEVNYVPAAPVSYPDSINPATGVTSSTITLTNGNLTMEATSGFWYGGKSKYWHTTGKKYFEITNVVDSPNGILAGLCDASCDFTFASNYVGLSNTSTRGRSWGIWANRAAGILTYGDDTNATPSGTPITTGGRISVAVDFDAGKLWFGLDGAWVGSGNPAAGTNPTYTFTPNMALFAATTITGAGQKVTHNFGASAFAYTLPSGFESWNTLAGNTATFFDRNVESAITLSGGNLAAKRNTGVVNWYGVVSTNAHSTGKKYFEVTQTVYSSASMMVGLCQSFLDAGVWAAYPGTTNYLGYTSTGWGLLFNDSSTPTSVALYNSAVPSSISNAPLLTNGSVVGVAVDFDAGKAWFSLNGTWIGSGNPVTGANPSFTFTANSSLVAALSFYDNVAEASVNFGVTPFTYTQPTGFGDWGLTPATGAPYIQLSSSGYFIARDSFGGLSHLEGETVSILGDGAVFPQKVVTGGTVTLDQPVQKAIIGLPITADIQTLPLAMNIDGGYGQNRPKNVNRLGLRVYRSSGLFAGPSTDKLTEFKQRTTEPAGTPPSLKTDEIDIAVTPSWSNMGGQVYIRQADPLPVTLVSITTDVTVGN